MVRTARWVTREFAGKVHAGRGTAPSGDDAVGGAQPATSDNSGAMNTCVRRLVTFAMVKHPTSLELGFGAWCLVFRSAAALDCWMLDCWMLDCWMLDCWMLDVGLLDVGCWMLDVRCWTFDVRCSVFDVPCFLISAALRAHRPSPSGWRRTPAAWFDRTCRAETARPGVRGGK